LADDEPIDEDPGRPAPEAARPTEPHVEARQPGDGAPDLAADPEPEGEAAQAYHQRARLAEDRLAEVLAAYRQIKSENESYRDRITKNVQRRFTQRHETLLLKFIDILDNLDRALEAAQISYAGQPLIEGMILVRTQLLQRLKEEGLERIPVLGLPFDPEVAEAVGVHPVPDPDHNGLVVKDLLRGYRVNGRIVRPARVLIGQYVEGAPAAAAGVMIGDAAPAAKAAAAVQEPAPVTEEDPSIEEIVARAEAQSALFPGVLEGKDEDGGGSDPDG
jgi:molecular chaperone GrpE (heat shock protein)